MKAISFDSLGSSPRCGEMISRILLAFQPYFCDLTTDFYPRALLRACHRMRCSRPQDRMFALHGLLSERTNIKLPRPDYIKSVEQVVFEYWLCFLQSPGGGALLNYCVPIKRQPGQKSWITDYAEYGFVGYQAIPQREPTYSVDLKFSADYEQLLVKGIVVDSVGFCSTLSFPAPPPLEQSINEIPQDPDFSTHTTQDHSATIAAVYMVWSVRVLREWVDLACATSGEVSTSPFEELAELFWNRRRMNKSAGFTKTCSSSRESYRKLITLLHQHENNNGSPRQQTNDESGLLDTVTSAVFHIQTSPKLAHLVTTSEFRFLKLIYTDSILRTTFGQICESSYYCKLLRTANGRLGIVLHTVLPGDLVFMYHGSELLALIRKAGSHHLWISRLWVQGLMEYDVFPDDVEQTTYHSFI